MNFKSIPCVAVEGVNNMTATPRRSTLLTLCKHNRITITKHLYNQIISAFSNKSHLFYHFDAALWFLCAGRSVPAALLWCSPLLAHAGCDVSALKERDKRPGVRGLHSLVTEAALFHQKHSVFLFTSLH